MTRQALPVLALHTSDCVTQPKGPVFTGLHRDGRMKMVEPGARCSSVDVVVVGMQGMKHRVEWLTAFEEFKRAGSPQIAFAEGITDAKRDFETKKIDVTFDNNKYLPIIVTNRGINITNVSVDKLALDNMSLIACCAGMISPNPLRYLIFRVPNFMALMVGEPAPQFKSSVNLKFLM